MSDILKKDMETFANSAFPFESFCGKKFLITGATGLIGSLIVKTLLFLNEKKSLNISIWANVRNINKAIKLYEPYLKDTALHFCVANLGKDKLVCDDKIDFIIHAASVTASKVMVTDPVGTVKTSVIGTKDVLNFAIQNKAKSVVYISSMEVYGEVVGKERVSEENLGYIDLTNPRSCYPEGKRMCEMLCTAFHTQYGLNVTSARLAQTFGAGILPTENRVFAQFAKSVVNGDDIVLHTTGKSEGNYVYTMDAVGAILLLLLKGIPGQAYNISNPKSHTTIKEMAKLVAVRFSKGKSQVVIDIPKESNLGYAPETKLWLDISKIKKLGWYPTVGLEESYKRMIMWLIEQKTNL